METIQSFFKGAFAVIVGLLWALVPRRFRHDRPFQRRGVHTILHLPYHADTGWMYAIYFGSGAGYRGGATAYIALSCRTRAAGETGGFRSAGFRFGVTTNANHVPLPGRC